MKKFTRLYAWLFLLSASAVAADISASCVPHTGTPFDSAFCAAVTQLGQENVPFVASNRVMDKTVVTLSAAFAGSAVNVRVIIEDPANKLGCTLVLPAQVNPAFAAKMSVAAMNELLLRPAGGRNRELIFYQPQDLNSPASLGRAINRVFPFQLARVMTR